MADSCVTTTPGSDEDTRVNAHLDLWTVGMFLSDQSQATSRTSGAVLRKMDAETGWVEDRRVVVLVQNCNSDGNAAVQFSNVLPNDDQLHPRVQKRLPIQFCSLTDEYDAWREETTFHKFLFVDFLQEKQSYQCQGQQ